MKSGRVNSKIVANIEPVLPDCVGAIAKTFRTRRSSNALTISANGSEKINGSTDDLTVSTERAANTLVYTDSTQGWLLKNN